MGLVKLTVLDLRNKVPNIQGPGVAISPLLPVLSLFLLFFFETFFVTLFLGHFVFMGGGGGQGLVFIPGAFTNSFGLVFIPGAFFNPIWTLLPYGIQFPIFQAKD